VRSVDVIVEAGRLAAEGKPYVLATVVNVVRPASARRGDRALVTPDGRVTGWIGGACSEPAVVREALRALADREPRVARMEGGCASEGVVEVLIEPVVPAPLLAIVGDSPAARTLGELARTVGWRVRDDGVEGADAVVERAQADRSPPVPKRVVDEVPERLLEPRAVAVEYEAVARGGFDPLAAEIVGEDSLADRTPSGLFHSDHAGVVARLRLP